jgi:hypothetical protein
MIFNDWQVGKHGNTTRTQPIVVGHERERATREAPPNTVSGAGSERQQAPAGNAREYAIRC